MYSCLTVTRLIRQQVRTSSFTLLEAAGAYEEYVQLSDCDEIDKTTGKISQFCGNVSTTYWKSFISHISYWSKGERLRLNKRLKIIHNAVNIGKFI
jgi:hypothetical protein